jgi:hypothetical protein
MDIINFTLVSMILAKLNTNLLAPFIGFGRRGRGQLKSMRWVKTE